MHLRKSQTKMAFNRTINRINVIRCKIFSLSLSLCFVSIYELLLMYSNNYVQMYFMVFENGGGAEERRKNFFVRKKRKKIFTTNGVLN